MRCLKEGCPFDTDEQIDASSSQADKLAVLRLHVDTNHLNGGQEQVAVSAGSQVHAERMQKPKLVTSDGMVAEEDWEFFVHSWKQYKALAKVAPDTAPAHLSMVLGEVSGRVFNRVGKVAFEALTEAQLLDEAAKLAVKKRNKLVNRIKLSKMAQDEDESVTAFETRLKPVARTGKYRVKCKAPGCGEECDYTAEVVLDNLIRGLADEEIQRKVLALPDEDCTLTKVVKFVEAEEMGRQSMRDTKDISGDMNALSSYRRQKRDPVGGDQQPGGVRGGRRCYDCGGNFPHIKDDPCSALKEPCKRCKKFGHVKRHCPLRNTEKGEKKKEDHNEIVNLEELLSLHHDGNDGVVMDWEYGDLSLLEGVVMGISESHSKRGKVAKNRRVLGHLVYDRESQSFVERVRSKTNRMNISIEVDNVNYGKLWKSLNEGKKVEERKQRMNCDKVHDIAIGDTGATVCCTGTAVMKSLGLVQEHLLPTNLTLVAANRKSLSVLGAVPVMLEVMSVDGSTPVMIRDLMYVVEELKHTYISRDALEGLGSVNKYFPLPPPRRFRGSIAAIRGTSSAMVEDKPCIQSGNLDGPRAECGCPVRTEAPDVPPIPFPPTEENRERLEAFLKEKYRSSTFNTCNHQPLPLMHGPPLQLHIKKDAVPTAIHVPGQVPVHWYKKVMQDIKDDVAKGVLEEVEPNTPVTWCHRMHIARKHNGDPRRTVDLRPLNDVSVRQSHPTAPPFQQAMGVPKDMKKSTLDAWNGYHSVEVREEDRHYLTFLTPEGRYRYRTAPQGYMASGDAYTHRYDLITRDVRNMKRVIDDTLLYSEDLEKAYYQVAEYLVLVGRNGIILNPDKFSFGCDEVNWAGVRLTKDKVLPLEEHVEAIRNFPTPVNVTDMRSYWALVNQVSHYYAASPKLAPFRELLKKNVKWYWDDVLQDIFEESRAVIADEIIKGITTYDINRWTALLSDWSTQGIGFVMSQKYCACTDITPICCAGGWKVCMVGSSFLSPAESRYAPIEGECLAVVNALYKTRHYTQGCDRLLVCTDHKPLVPVLNTKRLEDIENPRLLKLREKTLGWRFKSIHIPGRKLGGPDALSRTKMPAELSSMEEQECILDWGEMTCKEARLNLLAAIRTSTSSDVTRPHLELDVSDDLLASMELGVRSITWDMVKKQLHTDSKFRDLSDWIIGGCVGPAESLPHHIKPFWRLREQLTCVEYVPMCGERTVIPEKLQPEVKKILHSAHQSVLSMGLRASQSVFWPNIWSDLETIRQSCFTCHKIAPSQARLPPVEPIVPDYPFQHIAVDYMTLEGYSYGVFVDRYSGWPGVYIGSKAKDVTTFLSRLCEDYGCPETVTTDGAANLTAKEVEDFMAAYGIHHRVTSVANPHANSRAELGVRTVKRMLRGNIGQFGKLETAKFSQALLTLRNTPDRDTRKSPAQVLFGRPLRDFLPSPKRVLMSDMWVKLADQREQALARRSTRAHEDWSAKVKQLPPLLLGDSVFVQNQTGNSPKRWDKRGVVVECGGNDQYKIRLDGSRRVTLRNRRYLRKFQPFQTGHVIRDVPENEEDYTDIRSEQCDRDDKGGIPTQNDTVVTGNEGAYDQSAGGQQGHQQVRDSVGHRGVGLSPGMGDNSLPEVPATLPSDTNIPIDVEGQSMNVPVPDIVPPESSPTLRRSSREGRGQTTRYKDFDMS